MMSTKYKKLIMHKRICDIVLNQIYDHKNHKSYFEDNTDFNDVFDIAISKTRLI